MNCARNTLPRTSCSAGSLAAIPRYELKPSCEVPVIQGVQTVFVVSRHFRDFPARDAPPLSPQVFPCLQFPFPDGPRYTLARAESTRAAACLHSSPDSPFVHGLARPILLRLLLQYAPTGSM